MRRKPASPEVATPAEVWENIKRVPLGIFQIITFPDTWLCFALIILLGALYVMVPALLLSYLPYRLFGATKGTFGLDLSVGILLSVIGGLIIWGKVNRARVGGRFLKNAPPTPKWKRRSSCWICDHD